MATLKDALRGYDILHSSGQLGKINEIKLALTNTRVGSIDGKASKIIFGNAVDKAELITRQYLLMVLADLALNKQLLSSFAAPEKEITLALPKEWRKIISGHGIKIAKTKSALRWIFFLVKFLYTQVMMSISVIYDCVLKILNVRPLAIKTPADKYVYFLALSENNLPQPDKKGASLDIISWYVNWEGRRRDVSAICHGVKDAGNQQKNGIQIAYLPNPFLPFYTKKAIAKYAGWYIRALLTSFFNLLIGRWWNVFLLEEANQATKIRLQDADVLGREYLFHNSGWIYRPLWTYEAEERGSDITFYFYSTNCETFDSGSKKMSFHYGYQSMKWPRYLVWDTYQAEFVRNAVGEDANISIVGPIWFSTSSKEPQVLPAKTIAVFDVQPMRDAFYKTLGIEFEYYIPRVCNQFLSDIFEVATMLNITMALKRKRNIGRKVHPFYRNFVKQIEHADNFAAIDTEIPAEKVIANSSLVISMPFTSTAILGRELNKPSVFYDPLYMLQKDDHAAHGIQVISGIEELKNWVISNINSN